MRKRLWIALFIDSLNHSYLSPYVNEWVKVPGKKSGCLLSNRSFSRACTAFADMLVLTISIFCGCFCSKPGPELR